MNKIKTKRIDLSVPDRRDPNLQIPLTLVGHLMNLDNCNMSWDEFRCHSFVMDSINYVDELRRQHNMN